MKLVIVWNNGDKEKFHFPEERARSCMKDLLNVSWNEARLNLKSEGDPEDVIDFRNARRVYLEE